MKKIFCIALLVGAGIAGWSQDTSAADLSEDDFFGEGTSTVTSTTTSTVDPTEQFTKSSDGLHWGGSVSSSANWTGAWTDWPDVSDLQNNFSNSLGYTLSTLLALDGRPTKDFRFHLSVKTGAPFTTTTSNVTVPNLKIWEMYTDVTLADTVFLRFGKQSASWGVAYFYSPGDVISLTAKDATDPTASREGPVALNATIPFPNQKANLTGYVLLRDDYFPVGTAPTFEDLGYALQGDILVGEAQLSLGGFYQKDNAPKAVATINTGLGFLPIPELNKINLFSEGIVLWGADVLKGTGSVDVNLGPAGTKTVFDSITKWDEQAYFTGTVGASYSNSDWNLSLRTEYWYNPFGSSDADYASRAFNSFLLNTVPAVSSHNTSGRTYGYGDVANPGIHNLTTLIGLSDLFGSKINFSALWQQNLSDGSGWVKPSFSWSPWDELSLSAGWSQVWGDDTTQFPLQFQDLSTGKPKRVSFNVSVNFGTGKY